MKHFNERFADSGKFKSYNGNVYYEIFKNPSPKELRSLFQTDFSGINFNDLRGILTLTGDLYIITCEEVELVHDEIVQILDDHGYLGYDFDWNQTTTPKYIAIFIRDINKLKMIVSEESHMKPIKNIEDFLDVSNFPIFLPDY